ncbi:DUF6020 family protein [Nocardioides sp.]|uniref:DUF6020 family protein n=1 Tax=Nocardioides sp. TaxID=35761 RepID=UPI00271D3C74|nr:DUF6020 family protein [Nocardioides sp.]MDO9456981.1 DUF6020 family protein [Nocardioides sp.]
MLGGASKWVAPVVSWLVVVVVAVATTAGLCARYLTPDGAPYLLLSREVGDHTLLALLFLGLSLAAYSVVFLGLRAVLDAWRDGPEHPAPAGARAGQLVRVVDWTFARWWRVSLVLAVLWLPWFLSSFPGQPSPDPSNMITEFVSRRSDFAGASLFADGSGTPPYVDYPTSTYLLTDGDSLWSNHHPFFLMLAHGSVCSVSIAVFDSLVPALVVLSAASVVLTLVAFGRALAILGALVPGWRHRALALVVLGLSPLIALWSMAEHKNQLFCAAFVWWLALLARLVHHDGPTSDLGRRWYVETFVVSWLMAVTVQFGWILLVAQTLAMLLVRRRRVAVVVAVGLPAVLVYGSISIATSAGALIPSDPIETKGVQLQVLALVLTEHPDALTAQERADLSQVFDLDAFVASFDPSTSDPLKSTGPLERKSASFKYETVDPDDWRTFNGIVADVAKRYPETAVDGLFLKSYRYLDPFDAGTDWYPPWSPSYDRTIDGHRVAPLAPNLTLRGHTRDRAFDCYGASVCRPVISHGVRTVVVVLLLAAAIGVRRRFAWLWALPFALQLAIAGVSPLSAGGRYVLAFTYGLAIVLLLLAIEDRPRPAPPAPGSRREQEPEPVGR